MTIPYYNGLEVDRATGRRGDRGWIAGLLEDSATTVLPMWRDRCLVAAGHPVRLRPAAAGADPVLLGLDGGRAVFAVDLSELDERAALEAAGADTAVDTRGLVPTLSPAECGLLAYARGILHWNRNQRFCGTCGGRTEVREAGHLRGCLDCDRLLFPKIEPAVIVLVELPGTPNRCLLGRHRGAGPDRFSTLAGFVEIGESLEDAVRREVAEEAGVAVSAVRYQGSQAWPFPAGIMLGFRAVAAAPDIAADGAELAEARWFSPAELRARLADPATGGPYRVDSIGQILIENWLADNE
ncbi:MAG TPA: NAD(+) diphosphatase [Actinophytocola sp.]|uniref:NAD(+) diphosphatase n=1 Tax=Actinophytocola sp. TaxID=1872138 RepID=UPI002DB7CED3|nr:NAD(+) diphosphatase [Actinophytocola sp.]HEU5470100.1 NAD(+) diphosphatase [Actinophytocola sp.]